MIGGLRLVYSRRGYLAAAVVLFPVALTFYAWAGQVLIVGSGGVSYLIQPDVIVAVLVLAALLALSLPLQAYALKLAVANALQVGGSVVGMVIGTASLGCCAPVILPSLLSLLGFSGTTILSVNITVHRYFVPLALLSALLLGYSVCRDGRVARRDMRRRSGRRHRQATRRSREGEHSGFDEELSAVASNAA